MEKVFQQGKEQAALLDALPVPVDLLIYTPEEFALGMERRIGVFDAIDREGVLLYARSES